MTNFTLMKNGRKLLFCEKGLELIKNNPLRVSCSNHNNRAWVNILLDNKMCILHRFLINAKKNEQVDHINRNALDNRICNLRICTPKQNSQNRKMRTDNKLFFKGIQLSGKKFRARIMVDRKNLHLGNFKTKEEAAKAYDEAAIIFFGEFALTNKILGLLGDNNAII